MRLKAVELQGFKSFPDKTHITFSDGVTAIIGPNGSGKSNISDAVRWVLGEMSLKSLRGSKMEDVIFNGAAGRNPANYTYVSITFDTGEEYAAAQAALPAGGTPAEEEQARMRPARLGDGLEVTVTRKYYRSGESEYYINKRQVRLKDIYELFYDTGIGREGYSVISQGKISEVLSQKGDERRSIFEEAAGISKIRYKKLESERKLRDTEQNLLRVNDILSEVAVRVEPLRKEAENAKRYLVLNEEKTALEITLWLDRIDKLKAERERVETSVASAKLELDTATEALDGAETGLDALINETYAQGATNQQIYNFTDNADATHPATLKLYISDSVVRINKMLLNIQFEAFRAYEKAIGGGGGQTTSSGGGQTTSSGGGSTTSSGGGSTTSSGGGTTSSSTSLRSSNTINSSDNGGSGGENHNHGLARGDRLALIDYNNNIIGGVNFVPSGAHTHPGHTHTVGSHTHSVSAHTHRVSAHTHTVKAHTHTVQDHTHKIEFGIYEGARASSATIKVDGVEIPAPASYDNLDIVEYLKTDGSGKIQRNAWHTIQILPNSMSRIVGAVFMQTFCNSRGGGDY